MGTAIKHTVPDRVKPYSHTYIATVASKGFVKLLIKSLSPKNVLVSLTHLWPTVDRDRA